MKSLPLVNIYNKKREIYLFCRDDKGNLSITKNNESYPYFYEPDEQGKYTSFDGKKLRKVSVTEPSEVRRLASNQAYESDVRYPQRYILDNIDIITPAPYKYALMDIECLKGENEFPDPLTAKFPVTSVSLYNSKYNKIRTWFIGDFGTKRKQAELDLFKAFVEYMQKAKFDLLSGWFMNDFDWPYLYRRFEQFPQKYFFEKSSQYNNLASAISPIHMVRGGKKEYDNFYPAGTSIVDYLMFFKKVYKNEKSYALDKIAEKYLGRGKEEFSNVDFSVIDDNIKYRNIRDVELMRDLELTKFKLLPIYDEMRRLTKCQWEDFVYPMRQIDPLVLTIAKQKGVILPSAQREMNDPETFKGADRDALKVGRFFKVGKYDLDGAYLNIINDLNLDATNLKQKDNENCIAISIRDRKTDDIIETHYIEQNPEAIMPTLARQLIEAKAKYKALKKNTNPELPEYKNIELVYEAVKTIFLVAWGTLGNKFYRLYNKIISGLITSSVRFLLHHLIRKTNEDGSEVIYFDTDALFCLDQGINIQQKLASWIQEWSQENFYKPSAIRIDYEGHFESLFIITTNRYRGYLNMGKGTKKEDKGIQVKRVDSSYFIAEFQDVLLDKLLLEKIERDETVTWVLTEIERMKVSPFIKFSFPCRLATKAELYKTEVTTKKGKTYTKLPPIHVQASMNAKKLYDLDFRVGENYYYIYINYNDKMIPMAFDEKRLSHIKGENINWDKMVERNILNIATSIFDAMKWPMDELITPKVRKPRKVASNASKKAGECPTIDDLKQPKVSLPPKIKVKPANNTQLIDTTRVVTEYYISSPLITGNVRVDINEKIIWAIPAWNKFIGFDLSMFVKTIHADKVEQILIGETVVANIKLAIVPYFQE